MKMDQYELAFHTNDMDTFIDIMVPPQWNHLANELKQLDMSFSQSSDWCPGWSNIPRTVRGTATKYEDMLIRSTIFRFHDLIHNIWCQPTTSYNYLRTQIDGEIAALTISEILYPRMLYQVAEDDVIKESLIRRFSMYLNTSEMSITEIALWMRALLCPINGSNVKSIGVVELFTDYFKKMLQQDYDNIVHNMTKLQGFDIGIEHKIDYGHDPLLMMMSNFENIISGCDIIRYKPSIRISNFPNDWR